MSKSMCMGEKDGKKRWSDRHLGESNLSLQAIYWTRGVGKGGGAL